jgi:hypothetical protein
MRHQEIKVKRDAVVRPLLALQRRALLFEWLVARVREAGNAKPLVKWALIVDLIEVAVRHV